MIKKSIRHFNRGLVIGVEIVGFFAFLAFMAWLGLLWRLSQGPINVDFLTAKLETTLNTEQAGFTFDVGTTNLTWGGNFEPFELEMRNVRISRADATPVLAVEKLGIQVSKRNLIFGRIVPKVVKVYGPALRVIRWEDGHFSLNLGEAPATPDAAPAEEADTTGLIKNLLKKLEQGPSLLGGLEEVRVSNAAIFYEDKIAAFAWRARKADVVIARSKGGIGATVLTAVDMGEGRNEAIIRANVLYSWQNRQTSAEVYFGEFIPARIAQASEKLKHLSEVDLALKGSVSFVLDSEFKLGNTKFIIGADPGTFNALDLYPQPLKVEGLYIDGQYNGRTGAASIDQFKVNLGKPSVEARLRVTPVEGGRAVSVHAELNNTPLDELHLLWPEKLTPDPRAWVTGHLSKGVADKATLDTEFIHRPGAEKKIEIQKLGGKIMFQGIKVDYFPPLMHVDDAVGVANYDTSSFNLDISGGKLGDMAVTRSVIKITGLDKAHDANNHSEIDIAVSLEGPLKTALEVLDSKPLEYPKMLGLSSSSVGGRAAVDVSFRFPLHKSLRLDEVKVKADARVHDVSLQNIVAGYPLTGGPLDLSVGGNALSIRGAGKLGDMPVTFDWNKHFGAGGGSALTAKLPLTAEALVKFGVPADMKFAGTMPSDVIYKLEGGGSAVLTLKGDVTGASFEVPQAGYRKLSGEGGAVDLKIHLKGGRAEKITDLTLKTDKAFATGGLEFKAGADGVTELARAQFTDVSLGDTRVSLKIDNKGAAGYVFDVKGAQLDASSVFSEDSRPGDDAEAAKKSTPMKVSLSVKKLLTSKDFPLDNVKVYLHRNEWRRLEQLEMDAVSGGKPVYLRYMPVAGGHSLRFEAGNASTALASLGLTKAVRGGNLVIKADPLPKSGPRDMFGTAVMTNFALKDVPVLGKLLNALSLPGLIELLNNSGVSFRKARVDFTWTDRGQPGSNTNVRLLKLKDGQTSGSSLGLTFEGNIDNWKHIYDLNGTIIPVSDINKLLSIIPIVGDVLTAGGEGVFAATYTIKGPKDQPSVMVNPLAALAPGVLRKLFFEN